MVVKFLNSTNSFCDVITKVSLQIEEKFKAGFDKIVRSIHAEAREFVFYKKNRLRQLKVYQGSGSFFELIERCWNLKCPIKDIFTKS